MLARGSGTRGQSGGDGRVGGAWGDTNGQGRGHPSLPPPPDPRPLASLPLPPPPNADLLSLLSRRALWLRHHSQRGDARRLVILVRHDVVVKQLPGCGPNLIRRVRGGSARWVSKGLAEFGREAIKVTVLGRPMWS
jgi:hypothetical protein